MQATASEDTGQDVIGDKAEEEECEGKGLGRRDRVQFIVDRNKL